MKICRNMYVAGLLLLGATAFGQSVSKRMVAIHEDPPPQMYQATPMGPKPSSDLLHITVSFNFGDPQGIKDFVDAVSDPKNPNYRQFMTPEQVGARFGLPAVRIRAVADYLVSQGMAIQLVAKNRLAIMADATVAQAQAAFQTQIQEFAVGPEDKLDSGNRFSFISSPSLPSTIAPDVVHVSGLESFTRPKKMYLTPGQIEGAYTISSMFGKGFKGQGRTIGISNYDGFRKADEITFVNTFSLPAPAAGAGTNVSIVHVSGGTGDTTAGNQSGEGDLDIQASIGMAPLANIIVYDNYTTSGNDPIGVLTKEANDNVADIISESYGWAFSSGGASAAHNAHLAINAAGITYLAASGDHGTNYWNSNHTFQYDYPQIDPEVLTVGGTSLTVDSTNKRTSEVGWNNGKDANGVYWQGGGGWVQTTDSFNVLPSYQKGTGVPTNIPYRLIPDVALDADPHTGYVVFIQGTGYVIGGTSGASPCFAGALAVCEQQLIADGYLTANGLGNYRYGRINDLFYSLNGDASIFYDVISGTNGTLPNGNVSNAGTGWDFDTGWGPMIFTGFVNKMESANAVKTITLNPTTVTGGSTSTATVTLTNPANASGVVVTLTSSGTDAQVPATITITSGASTGTFTVNTNAINISESLNIKAAYGASSQTAVLGIVPAAISSVALSPSTVVGPNSSTGTVTLNGPAGPSGVVVTLTSQAPASVSVPASVTVAAGQTSATFTATTVKSNKLSYTNDITATLAGTSKVATLTVQGDSVTSLTLNPSTIGGAGTSTGTVTLAGAAPAGGWVVNLSAGNTSYATVQATVTVPAGAATATFPITAFQRGGTVSTVITASDGGSTATATLTVTGDSLKSLTLTPSTIGGDQTSTGTVTLNSPAPAGGWVVTLKAGVASYASMPSSITIPAGSSTGTFTISSSQRASTVTFGIYANDVGSQVSALLTVTGDSILSFTLNPTTVGGNQTSTGTVTLKAAAPAGGWLVTLKCGVPADLSFPSSITIPEGQTVGTFTITPKQLASTIAIGIYANDVATNLSATLTVTGDSMASMVFNPTSIGGDQTSTATITLNSAAPTGGWIINLKSGAPTVASIPSSITIPAGSTTGTFTITGHHYSSNTNVLIIANDGVTALNGTISVLGDSIAGFTINPTTIGGNQTATGTVTLTSNAPPGGWLVNIKSGLPNTAAVPVSITIPQGSNTGTFTITAGQHPGSATIPIYVYDGISNRTVNITVLGDSLASVTLNPSTIGGNGSTTGTVTLTSPAPVGGWLVTFKPAVTAYATVTPSITIPAGQTTGTFTVTSSQRVATVTFNILASDGGSNQSASLTVVGDSITGMSLSPTTIGGNGTSTGTVTLSAAAPQGGWLVTLKSAVPSYVSVPASIVIPQGATSGTFVVTPKQLASNVTVGIYANDGATGANATITINGDSMASFTINPTTVKGGTGSTGTVTLNAPAPAGGWTITLKVGAPSLVGVPATVVVPAGATSVTFAITTKVVTSQTAVGIYASDGPTNLNQTITITP